MAAIVRMLGLCVVSVMVAAAPGARAAQPWREPRAVDVKPDAAAIDDRGYAIVVGEAGGQLRATRRTPRRGFGEPFSIAPNGADAAAVVSRGRTTTIAYRRYTALGYIHMRQVLSGGARTQPRVLAPADAMLGQTGGPSISSLPDGPFLAWWMRFGECCSPSLQLSAQDAAGGLLPARTHGFALDYPMPAVAVEPDGRPLVAFAGFSAAAGYQAEPLRRVAVTHPSADGSLTVEELVTDRSARINSFAIDVAPDGAAVLAWTQQAFAARGAEVLVARRPPGGTFADPVTLSRHGRAADSLAVTTTAGGDPLVAWLARERADCHFCSHLMLAEPGDDAARIASPRRERVQRFELAADARGGATLAWTSKPRRAGAGLVSARAITPARRLGRIERLNDGHGQSRSIRLAVGPRGDALVAWAKDDGTSLASYRPASEQSTRRLTTGKPSPPVQRPHRTAAGRP